MVLLKVLKILKKIYTLSDNVNSNLSEKIYTFIMKVVARVVHPLERQGEGKGDLDTAILNNPGNFIASFHRKANFCPELHGYIKRSLKQNLTLES